MSILKTLIVDDELAARRRLNKMLESYHTIQVVGEAINGVDAVDKIRGMRPELVFLDIQMPKKNGLEVALETYQYHFHLVFVTAFNEYALRAFETRAVDYLLKPVTAERLQQCLEKIERLKPYPAMEQLQALLYQMSPTSQETKQIGIRHGTATLLVTPEHIAYLESEEGYRRVHLTKNGKELHQASSLLTDMSLEQLLDRLPDDDFLRVHRSFVVNIQQVRSYHPDGRTVYLVLRDFPDLKLSVSRTNTAIVKKMWG